MLLILLLILLALVHRLNLLRVLGLLLIVVLLRLLNMLLNMLLRVLRLHFVLLGLGEGGCVLGLHRSGLGVHLRLLSVLRVDGDLGTQNLEGTIVAATGEQVLALRAVPLGIFEPVGETGDASQTDADETEEDTDDATRESVSDVYT